MTDASTVFRAGLLDGKNCLVSGAGSGIGRAISLRLLSLGATVVGIGRRIDRLEETGTLAGSDSARFRAYACNVRDSAALETLIDEFAELGGLDLLVNNAGGQFYAPLEQVSRKGWDSVIDLNLTAIFTALRAARAHLARRRGSVVNISLTGVDRGMMGGAHALAARAGVLALTRSLALEWAADGIRLNCIGPGVVATEGLAGPALEKFDEFVSAVPLGRATQADEIAELVVFLGSEAGRMMTGQLFQIDGGAHIGPGLHPWSPAPA